MCELDIIFWKVVTLYYSMIIKHEIHLFGKRMRFVINISTWDGEKILHTFIYDEEGNEMSLYEK